MKQTRQKNASLSPSFIIHLEVEENGGRRAGMRFFLLYFEVNDYELMEST